MEVVAAILHVRGTALGMAPYAIFENRIPNEPTACFCQPWVGSHQRRIQHVRVLHHEPVQRSRATRSFRDDRKSVPALQDATTSGGATRSRRPALGHVLQWSELTAL